MPYPWLPGEHVTVIGDTGTGKTFLISRLVRLRRFVVVFKTKPDDIRWPGFTRVRKADALDNTRYERLILEPEYRYQPREGYAMLERVWEHGGWTVVIDEFWYTERLGLRDYVERLLTQGRSKGISTIVGMQRPVTISRFAISQSTHLFSFRVEGRDAKTIAESTTPRMMPVLDNLTGHDFAYYHRGRREIATGNARNLQAVIDRPDLPKTSAQTLDTARA